MKFIKSDIVILIAEDDNTIECGFEFGKEYEISEVDNNDGELWFDTHGNNLSDTAWQNPDNFQLKQPIYEIY